MPDAFDVRHHIDAKGRTRAAIDAEIARLATRQHGVVSRSQLAGLGLGRGAIARRLEHGRLHPIHRGVYAVGHRVLTRRAAWMAATLVAENAVLSHRSAAALWGIHESDRGRIDITVPKALRARPRLEIHQARLPPDEITTHHGISVTTPARTLLDLAAILDPTRFERAATEAEIRRLTSPTSLEDLVARDPRRPGTKRRSSCSATTPSAKPSPSTSSSSASSLPRRGEPPPATNQRHLDLPPKPIEVDCLWPDHRLPSDAQRIEAQLRSLLQSSGG
jgi:hypothetical protein